jgi:RecA/RadA recombinase
MNLLERLKKNSKIKETSILETSTFFNNKDEIPTSVPAINIALSGSLDGGLQPGLLQVAGPSKHFKTSISLVIASAYMQKYPEAVLMFYDSEFGSPKSYFQAFGIDTSRVIHTPITDIEQLKFDIMSQLWEIQRGDKVIFLIDSIGNLASKKEVEDALSEKSVADMSRAKQLKSLFRMVTPHLSLKNIPMIAINHVYQEMGMFPKAIVSGGQGGYYSANDIWIIGRSQEKDGNDIAGYTFTINIEKSRRVKEKSKIPLTVLFNGGITQWSGLLDLALEAGLVIKPNVGWYQKTNPETGEILEGKYRQKDTNTPEFWEDILNSDKFKKFVTSKYRLVMNPETEENFQDFDFTE